jgi:transposase
VKRSYFTDLADAEWESLSSHVPAPNKRERPRIHCSRLTLDFIFFYVLRSGCPWRLLPRRLERLGRPSNYWFRRWHRRELRAAQPGAGRVLAGTAGKKSAQPEEHLYHYVHNSPEAIPVSVPQAFAEALYERAVQCLPAEDNSGGQQVNNVTGTITTADIRDDVNSRVIV